MNFVFQILKEKLYYKNQMNEFCIPDIKGKIEQKPPFH